MKLNDEIVEADLDHGESIDPDSESPPNCDVVTQPYDLVVNSLIEQIKAGEVILKPSFQRGYVWSNGMASKLIESIILNVPIPPCFLAQNEEFELDVVDGQQRLETIRRYIGNEFKLSGLGVLSNLNGLRFHKLPTRTQRQIKTHTVRCITISNKSDPDVRFDIFERLNSNMSSLNAQELRNCIYRGKFNDMLREMAEEYEWLSVLGRKTADKRMRGEEIILRFFAYQLNGLDSYRTPLKYWLNGAASKGRDLSENKISGLRASWQEMLTNAKMLFEANECFRRSKSKPINKALFDLVSYSVTQFDGKKLIENRRRYRDSYYNLLDDDEFNDLITRSIDHRMRTQRRFQLWNEKFDWLN